MYDLQTGIAKSTTVAKSELVLAIYELGVCFRHGWGVSITKPLHSVYSLTCCHRYQRIYPLHRTISRLPLTWAILTHKTTWPSVTHTVTVLKRMSTRLPCTIAWQTDKGMESLAILGFGKTSTVSWTTSTGKDDQRNILKNISYLLFKLLLYFPYSLYLSSKISKQAKN